ncbi:hypothetical protein [Cellulomonas composti]|uniref:Uncharacterized protein n=1 Tax=Cellulomonas composti TaxID=266130 RepID=A0A511JCE8_9CELL|nr:hypothetical protein [Cellulomonas composti]GEL95373.1 hypothetical protein CCO02nite_20310 [Cellulomonas composti]
MTEHEHCECVDRLRAWKDDALIVMGAYQDLAQRVVPDRPGNLGRRWSDLLSAYVDGLIAERDALKEREPKCDGWCSADSGPEETCSLHGRRVAEVWQIVDRVGAERDTLRAAVERVRALHRPGDGAGQGWVPNDGRYGYIEPYCAGCEASDVYAVAWPCATVRALDGEPAQIVAGTGPGAPNDPTQAPNDTRVIPGPQRGVQA